MIELGVLNKESTMNIKFRALRHTYGNVVKPIKTACDYAQHYCDNNGYEKHSSTALIILCFSGLALFLFLLLLASEGFIAIIMSLYYFSFSMKNNVYVATEILIPYFGQLMFALYSIRLIVLTLEWTTDNKQSFPSKTFLQVLWKGRQDKLGKLIHG